MTAGSAGGDTTGAPAPGGRPAPIGPSWSMRATPGVPDCEPRRRALVRVNPRLYFCPPALTALAATAASASGYAQTLTQTVLAVIQRKLGSKATELGRRGEGTNARLTVVTF